MNVLSDEILSTFSKAVKISIGFLSYILKPLRFRRRTVRIALKKATVLLLLVLVLVLVLVLLAHSMPSSSHRLVVLLLVLVLTPQRLEGQFEEWCIADEQTPDEELQRALDWACGKGGADCRKIQMKQSCFYPNTVKDHASYAFNSYYQKFKHNGASCYFNAAAMVTALDPSHGSCKFEYVP